MPSHSLNRASLADVYGMVGLRSTLTHVEILLHDHLFARWAIALGIRISTTRKSALSHVKKMMVGAVLANHEIRRTVILPVPVDVMNMGTLR